MALTLFTLLTILTNKYRNLTDFRLTFDSRHQNIQHDGFFGRIYRSISQLFGRILAEFSECSKMNEQGFTNN